ncbi:MAG: hypothetical protein GY861_17060 [bacterium]|nr:hypothetical protein [bacterium]
MKYEITQNDEELFIKCDSMKTANMIKALFTAKGAVGNFIKDRIFGADVPDGLDNNREWLIAIADNTRASKDILMEINLELKSMRDGPVGKMQNLIESHQKALKELGWKP